MQPGRSRVARELFNLWQLARGRRPEPAARPFSRNWEEFLEQCRMVTSVDRGDAEREARSLAEDGGWVELKFVRFKPHLIERIILPLAAEKAWCEAFGFVAPTENDQKRFRDFDWVPELAFLKTERVQIGLEELTLLNQFLKSGLANRERIPVKERSLQIFGDEKRLDILASSNLFGPGRLNLENHLCCENFGVPPGWKRGPAPTFNKPVIVLENAATWHSYCRWNESFPQFAAVIYGDGNRFVEGIRHVKTILDETGAAGRILYFGDLDPAGLWIPQRASSRAAELGLPHPEPHLWSYRLLLKLGQERAQPYDIQNQPEHVCDWLGELADQARHLFDSGKRLPQELIGWQQLAPRNRDFL